MINQLSLRLAGILIRNEVVKESDSEIYVYGFQILLGAVEQILILLAFGILFGLVAEIAFVAVSMVAIKPWIGGWHAPNHLSCVVSTTAIIMAGAILGGYLSAWVVVLAVGTSLVLVLRFAPIVHPNNPKSEEEWRIARKKAVILAIAEAFVILLLLSGPLSPYAGCAGAGYLIACTTLLIKNKGGATIEEQ